MFFIRFPEVEYLTDSGPPVLHRHRECDRVVLLRDCHTLGPGLWLQHLRQPDGPEGELAVASWWVVAAEMCDKPGFIFVHFSGYLRRAKVRFFELGNFLTELDQLLRWVRPFFGPFWIQNEPFLGKKFELDKIWPELGQNFWVRWKNWPELDKNLDLS